ncbi:MAG: DUF2807 domain-containing protein [Bacteroidales bacterium]|nr:DUF2807 domain-containing protein [Bacteroidales bacterium]
MKTIIIKAQILLIFLAILFSVGSSGCMELANEGALGEPVNGVQENRETGEYSALEIGGAFRVYLTQGDEEKLVVEADESEMDGIITEVVNGRLKIYLKPQWRGKFHKMYVYLTFKDLEYIDFGGAVKVTGKNALNFETLKMDVSGASDIDLEIKANKLDAEFSGASKIRFLGACEKGIVEMSGASDFKAADLKFSDLTVDASGAASARVYVTGTLVANASGAASIRHKGSSKITQSTSGAGSVKGM